MDQDIIDWLLSSDPSISFQVKRDLLDLPENDWIKDQKRIATNGWGNKLLGLQDEDGRWGGGLYGPKFISTHYTMMLLRRMNMISNNRTSKGCEQLIKIKAIGVTHTDEIRLDACITGMGLGILGHFREQTQIFPDILQFLEDRQLDDGGWNCRHPRVKTSHSSMHTTLSVLEGLANLGKNFPKYQKRIDDLSQPAHEFLLIHQLFKSHRTGEVIHPQFIDITFPPRWKFNILSAMDYFRSIEFVFDERMQDALELIKKKEKNGYWPKGTQMTGKKFFSLDPPRKPSA
ncbi:MAG: hypothetical protein ACW98K_07270, partial [Candidatus Kariarchaeaceae archaeon]